MVGLLSLAIAAVGVACQDLDAENAGTGALALQEYHSATLPLGYSAVGAALSEDGARAVVWSSQHEPVLVISSGTIDTVNVGKSASVVTVAVGGSELDVVRYDRVIATYSVSGHLLRSRRVPVADSLIDALRVDTVWYFISEARGRAFRLTRFGPNGDTLSVFIPAGSRMPLARPRLATGRTSRTLVVTYPLFPFRTVAYRATDLVLASRFALGQPEGSGAASDTGVLLIAGSLLRVECGYMQQVTDLRGDLRYYAFLDSAGHVTRWSQTRAPVGLLATAPVTRTLLAARVDENALVFYRWSWVNGGATRTETELRRTSAATACL